MQEKKNTDRLYFSDQGGKRTVQKTDMERNEVPVQNFWCYAGKGDFPITCGICLR